MRSERLPVDHRDKELELQLTSSSVYLQACMMLKNPRASEFLTAADVRFLPSVACMVATIFEILPLLPDDRIFKVAATAERKSSKGIWRTCFAEGRAQLIHLGYEVLDGLADALELPTVVLNV